MLESRHAVFLNYHEAGLPLQASDVQGNRYHPLRLDAALLGGLTEEDRRILGFGDQRALRSGYVRPAQFPSLDRLYQLELRLALHARDFAVRVRQRLKRLFGG